MGRQELDFVEQIYVVSHLEFFVSCPAVEVSCHPPAGGHKACDTKEQGKGYLGEEGRGNKV